MLYVVFVFNLKKWIHKALKSFKKCSQANSNPSTPCWESQLCNCLEINDHQSTCWSCCSVLLLQLWRNVCFLSELATDQNINRHTSDVLYRVLECDHGWWWWWWWRRGWGTLCRRLVWPWQSISVNESFKYSSVIALPRRGALSKQADRHLASLRNDHTTYLCDNQKLNRNRTQGSASTFRWLSHCCSCSVWSLRASHFTLCVFSLCVHPDNLATDKIYLKCTPQRQSFLFIMSEYPTPPGHMLIASEGLLRNTSMGAISSLSLYLRHFAVVLRRRGGNVELSNITL